jgi:hypothetical protein
MTDLTRLEILNNRDSIRNLNDRSDFGVAQAAYESYSLADFSAVNPNVLGRLMASPPIDSTDIFTGDVPYIRDMGWAYNNDTMTIESGSFIMDIKGSLNYINHINEEVTWSLSDSNESSDYMGKAIYLDLSKVCTFGSGSTKRTYWTEGPSVTKNPAYPAGICNMTVPIYFKSTKVFHYVENGSIVLDVPSTYSLMEYKQSMGQANYTINPTLTLAIIDVASISIEQHFDDVYVRASCNVTLDGDLPTFYDGKSYVDDGEDWVFPSGKYLFSPITALDYVSISYNYVEPANATAVGFTIPSISVLAEDILSIVDNINTILGDVNSLKQFAIIMAKSANRSTRNYSGITEFLSSKLSGEDYWVSDDSIVVLSRFLARSTDSVLKLLGTKLFSIVSDAIFASASSSFNYSRANEVLDGYDDLLLKSMYQNFPLLVDEDNILLGSVDYYPMILEAATAFLTAIKEIPTWTYSRKWTDDLPNNFNPMVYLISSQIQALGDFSKTLGKILAPVDPLTGGRLARLPRHSYVVVIYPFFDVVWYRRVNVYSFGNLGEIVSAVKQMLGIGSAWKNYTTTQTWNDDTGEWEGDDIKDKIDVNGSVLLASDHCVVTIDQMDSFAQLIIKHSGNYNLFFNNCRHIALQFFDYFARRVIPGYLPKSNDV